MRRELALSVVDQGLTSAFSLGLSLALIMLATPEEFGRFVIVQALLFVPLAVQGPLVLTPANFLLPGRAADVRQAQLSMLTSVNSVIVVLAAGIGALASLLYVGGTAALAAAMALFAVSAVRDYGRALFFVDGRAAPALAQNVVFIAVSAAAIAGLWRGWGPLSAVVTGMAAGSAVSLLCVRPALHFSARRFGAHLREYRTVWKETRWSLAGSLQTEAQSRGYAYIVDIWRGSAALGALQAGRLVLAPLALAVNAWARVARPLMVAALHREDAPEALRMLATGLLAAAALVLAYGVALVFAWPLLEAWVFTDRYPDIAGTATVWWFHSAVYCTNICLATFLQARRQFRRLAALIAVSAGASLTALLALSFTGLPTIWSLYVLVGGELVMLAGLIAAVLEGRARPYAAPLARQEGRP